MLDASENDIVRTYAACGRFACFAITLCCFVLSFALSRAILTSGMRARVEVRYCV